MADKPTAETIEATPPTRTKAQILADVYSLATQFSTCVEAFNLIHPSKDHDHAQKVALAKLGVQQGRLLIFGDAVGISAPPATIAKHMIPSHPGLTNPDPHLPVNFTVRDAKLDNEATNTKVKHALHEIAGRPSNMSREELMNVYGLKSPKTFSKLEYPALDTNRLEHFREQYALLTDLVRQSGTRANIKRNMSMTTTHWTVKESTRFNQYVKVVRTEVDALIDLLDVKEQVDKGMRSDIRCMAWHPDLSGPIVRQDWEKLKLIREACEVDYPQYIAVVDTALQYINDELKETSLANRRASLGLAVPTDGPSGGRRKSDYDIRSVPAQVATAQEKTHLQLSAERACNPNYGREKRPGWLSAFKFKSWAKSNKSEKGRSKSTPGPDVAVDPQRSMSEGEATLPNQIAAEDGGALSPIRSKSLSAIPDGPALDMDSRLKNLALDGGGATPAPPTDAPVIQENGVQVEPTSPTRTSLDKNALVQMQTASSDGDRYELQGATTVNSLIDRHDMYQGMGRIQTSEIRGKAHEFGN